jgi:hypothetical protein
VRSADGPNHRYDGEWPFKTPAAHRRSSVTRSRTMGGSFKTLHVLSYVDDEPYRGSV